MTAPVWCQNTASEDPKSSPAGLSKKISSPSAPLAQPAVDDKTKKTPSPSAQRTQPAVNHKSEKISSLGGDQKSRPSSKDKAERKGEPALKVDKVQLAAGQIKPAAPIPASTLPPSTPPASSSEPMLRGLPPTQNPTEVPSSTQNEQQPASNQQQPTVSGTVEYNLNQPPPEGLSLSQALDEALTKGPRASAIRSQLAIAKSGLAQAAIATNPVFFMDRGFIAEGVERRGMISTVEPPWKLVFRMMAAGRLYHQTKIDLMTTLWQLRADTRRAYTEAVIAQESEKTLSQLYDLTNRLLEVSSKRFTAGDVPELDVLRARLASAQAGVDLGVGRQRVVRAKQQLNVMLGRAVEQAVGIPRLPEFVGPKKPINLKAIRKGILPDFSRQIPAIPYFLDIAMENRLELKSLAMQVKVNDMNYKNAVAGITPNPNVAYGSSTENNLPSGPKLRGNFLTLNLEMPFTNMNQGDIAKYKATGRQLKYQILAQRNMVQADVSSAYNNLLAAREKIRVYQEHVLNDSNEVARLARRSYEVGQSDINSTLLAQQANIGIQMQYLDAVTSYQGAYTDLEQACGTPLE